MSRRYGFRLHPEARGDIAEIWEFIAADKVLAARRVRVEILDSIGALVSMPHRGIDGRISHPGLCAFFWWAITRLRMRRMNVHCWQSPLSTRVEVL